VDDGIVTLTGTVPSYAASVAAVEAAHRVAGVLDVVNNITIRASGRPVEADLAMAVRQALERDVFIPSDAIPTTVAHGVVTLTGEVEYWAQREAAEHAIQRLAGVLAIVNRITVRKRAVSAEEVQSAIEDALARLAEAEAHGIGVKVRDGKVILSGRVRSWAEKRAIREAASHAPGVQGVEDEVGIDYS
jgi:osmotically-inducible protein OsmY